MTRGGRQKVHDAPERRCVATGERGGKAGLIRFVVGPDNRIVPDLAEKLPGRGIWVRADRDAIATAIDRNLFSRGAKMRVQVDAGLTDMVEDGLRDRVVSSISLARKAGQAVAGLEKVKDAVATGDVACLLQAGDGSDREKSRLRPPEGENTYFDVLSAAELGMAFGRDRVVHAALIAGGLAALVRYESARLTGIRRKAG